MDDLLITPVIRAGPTSRLLKRQSLAEPGLSSTGMLGVQVPSLNQSLKLLDDALGSPITRQTEDVTRFLDMTRPDDTRFATRGDFTMAEDITRPLGADQTALLGEENPGVKATENLFDDFLSTSSGGESGAAALDSIAEFEQMVGDHVEVLRKLVGKIDRARDKFPKTLTVLEGLTNERNTWRLMGKLYNDRLVTCLKPPQEFTPPVQNSERQVIERLFQRSPNVRQAWIVVEWLERNAQDQMEEVVFNQMQYFSDSTVAWENTLSALQRGVSTHNMVDELDPDAPCRTGKQLHSLDQEDESRLVKALFGCVRCGLLEEGQDLCVKVGQSWRAATLEGWRLYHDPNFETGTGGQGDKLPVEGNKHRDVWKAVAWTLTQDSSLSQHERAVYAALCGNLAQLQPVCTSWEDLVWAGAKCAVDLMVETEIREVMVKHFEELPTEYWNTPHSLTKVFAEIVGRGGGPAREAESPYHVIQKHLILDDWVGLVGVMAGWVIKPTDPHLLRLVAHLVLTNRALGVVGDQTGEDTILQAYTEYLMVQDKLGLIPWYVARLPDKDQLPLYSAFLTGISDREDQRLCLYLGREAGLDMDKMVVAAVVLARQRNNEQMVESLAWLGHDMDSQAGDLLTQANCVVRKLLLDGQTELARTGAGMVPSAVVERAGREWRGEGSNLPPVAVREHLALQTFLTAMEAFNDWFDHFHRGQPVKPVLGPNPSFTERVAHEQRERVFQGEVERWRGGQMVQSRQAEEKIRAILTFPGGWLMEEEEGDETMDTREVGDDETERVEQMTELRSKLLPRTVTLLHSLLHSTAQFGKCVALADLVAGEQHGIYQAFTSQGVKELLGKIRESGLAGMEQGKDPWGFNKQ